MEALLSEASSFGLCQVAGVFKERINRQFHRPGNLKAVAGFKKQIELYPYKCRSKSSTHQPSVLIVFLTQMLKYLQFVQDCGVCGNNKESTS